MVWLLPNIIKTGVDCGTPDPGDDGNHPAFAQETYYVDESAGNVSIEVHLTEPTSITVEVDYTTSISGSTATANSDYMPLDGTLTIAAGESSQTFLLPILDDTEVETDTEEVQVVLSNSSTGQVEWPDTTYVVIQDDDGEPQTATGVLSGTVSSTAGDSLAGMTVEIWNLDYEATTTTGSDGSYQFSNLPVGTYDMSFYDPNEEYLAHSKSAVQVFGYYPQIVDAVLVLADTSNANGSIAGTVTNVPGTELVGIDVSVFSADGTTAYGTNTTDSNGQYTVGKLPTGDYLVAFNDPTGTYRYHDASDIGVVDGEPTTYDATLNAFVTIGSIQGTVTDSSSGEPLADVEVSVWGSGGSGFATTDQDGTYSITNLKPAADYLVDFSHTDYLPRTLFDIVVTESESAMTTVDVQMAPDDGTEPTGSISGTVTSAAGTPLQDIEVNAWSSWTTGTVETDSNGAYRIEALADGSYTLDFQDPTGDHEMKILSHVRVQNGSNTTRDIMLMMADNGQIDGTINVPDTVDLNNVDVALMEYVTSVWGWGGWWQTYDFSAADASSGTYTFDSLPAGDYIVRVDDWSGTASRKYYRDAAEEADADQLQITATSQQHTGIDVTLDAAGQIAGQLTNPPSGWGWAEAYRQEGDVWFYVRDGWINSDGSFEIKGLRPGTYRVRFSGDYAGMYQEKFYHSQEDAWDVESAEDVAVTSGAKTTLETIPFGPDMEELAKLPVDLYTYSYLQWQNRPEKGSEVTYEIDFGNETAGVAQNVWLTDTLPLHTRFVDWRSWGTQDITPTVSADGRTVVWEIGQVDAYSYNWMQMTVFISDTATVGSNLVNQVEIGTTSNDTNDWNNQDETRNTVKAPAGGISGTVMAPDGSTPLANVGVQILDKNGWWVRYTTTNAQGNYEVDDLDSGFYKLHFEDWGEGRTTIYPDEYYQDRDTLEDAVLVQVEAGLSPRI